MSTATIGQRRSFDGQLCTIRYVGSVQGTSGDWLGVEWDDPTRGKHPGEHKGVRYFTCMPQSSLSGIITHIIHRQKQPANGWIFRPALQAISAPAELPGGAERKICL